MLKTIFFLVFFGGWCVSFIAWIVVMIRAAIKSEPVSLVFSFLMFICSAGMIFTNLL